MTKRLTRAATGLVALGLASVGLVASAGPAAASDPRCTGAASYWTGFVHDTYIYMPSGPSAYNCGMSRGEVGEEVRALQDALNKCYGASLSVDGQFGPKTQAALKVAESTHGMTSSLGTYDSGDAVAFRFWGWYLDNNGNQRWRCARQDGPIFD
jgi:hypothetical protein